MERVWIVSESIYAQRESLPHNRLAEIVPVRDLNHLQEEMKEGERAVLLAPLPILRKAREAFPKALAMQLLPPDLNQEKLFFAVRSVLNEAKLQHDLEAAEGIAWKGGGASFEDPSIEFLGASILELSAARDMDSVEQTLYRACAKLAPLSELKVVAYPETASSREMGLYQLAVPIQYQGSLKAHIYLRFPNRPEQSILDQTGEVLLNLSDAIALAVERNMMITKAEETKTVWEASFDSVEDPVAILDGNYVVIRGNRAYGRFAGLPVEALPGRGPVGIDLTQLKAMPTDKSQEWDCEHRGKHYRGYFDPIGQPLGAARFVLRFHDVTEERNLTEKILAKEQVAELGILVGSVAHEINNPIGGILAIGQILMKDLEPQSSLYQDIENIVHSAERCKKIVQTMLSLVRKADEEKTEVALGELVQAALDLLGSEAKRLQVKLRAKPLAVMPETKIFGNRNRLLQVFFHLIQQSLLSIAEKKQRQAFDAYLSVDLIPGYGNVEVRLEDNGDSVKHEYEIQSSVAFTVSKMILDEHEASYFFTKQDGKNQQRLVFALPS